MRKTYIMCGLMRLATRRDRGAVFGEDRLQTCEARGEGMLDLCIKHLEDGHAETCAPTGPTTPCQSPRV
jgi:hypothetical protein